MILMVLMLGAGPAGGVVPYSTSGAAGQDWIFSYEGRSGQANAMTVDSEGNIYLTGYVDLGDFYNTRMATIKVGPAGQMLWVRIDDAEGIPGFHDGWAIAVDEAASAIYVTGDVADGIFVTVKYDLQGSELWRRTFAPGLGGVPTQVAVDPEGNVYVGGDTYGDGGTNQDVTVLKYSPQGTLLWESVYDYDGTYTFEWLRELLVDGEGNVFVAGGTDRGLQQGTDYLVYKVDTDGVLAWDRIYDGPGGRAGLAQDLAMAPGGHLFVAGDIDTGDGADIVTMRFDSAGNRMWRSTYDNPVYPPGFDHTYDLAVDRQGNAFVTGESWYGWNDRYYDVLLIRYDASGTQRWARTWDYRPGAEEDVGADVAIDDLGGVYVAGRDNVLLGQGALYDHTLFKYTRGGRRLGVHVEDDPEVDLIADLMVLDSARNIYLTGPFTAAEEPFSRIAVVRYSQGGSGTRSAG